MSKKILIIVEDYPSSESNYPMAYVHTRNKLYLQKNKDINISVLSFRAKKSYEWEGITVFSEKKIASFNMEEFDFIVSHAPNVKNHIRFIKKKALKHITFFLHGHEVLAVNKYYPKPYFWVKEKKEFLRNIYDYFKLKIISNVFLKNENFKFIFVSNWMKQEAYKNLKINNLHNSYVIHNPINEIFVKNYFTETNENKKYDFITIRPLNGSKYCVDIVYKLAEKYPQYKFKIIGKGQFFKFNTKLDNIEWDNNFYKPNELIFHLNQAKVALMPTRLDAQGVMMCELAAFGMPIITSDIPICKEMLGSYSKSYFIDNNNPEKEFDEIVKIGDVFIPDIYSRTNLLDKFDINKIITQELNIIMDSKK